MGELQMDNSIRFVMLACNVMAMRKSLDYV